MIKAAITAAGSADPSRAEVAAGAVVISFFKVRGPPLHVWPLSTAT
jgi:hypothetical protein